MARRLLLGDLALELVEHQPHAVGQEGAVADELTGPVAAGFELEQAAVGAGGVDVVLGEPNAQPAVRQRGRALSDLVDLIGRQRQVGGAPPGVDLDGDADELGVACGDVAHQVALTLWEAPDNVSMAAVALAIGGGGALSSLETTVLLTVDETMEALRKVEQVQYRAPGA